MADVFENFVENSTFEYGINPFYSYFLPGYTWKAGWKSTNTKLGYIKKIELLLENNIRGGVSSVMGDRLIQPHIKIKIFFIDANKLYGWAISQYFLLVSLKIYL